jgi:hypothetical protein
MKEISKWDRFLIWLINKKDPLERVAFAKLLLKRCLPSCHIHANPERKTKWKGAMFKRDLINFLKPFSDDYEIRIFNQADKTDYSLTNEDIDYNGVTKIITIDGQYTRK